MQGRLGIVWGRARCERALIAVASCRHGGVMVAECLFPFLFFSDSTSREAKSEEGLLSAINDLPKHYIKQTQQKDFECNLIKT
jgi:hypothetical protein